MNTLSICIPAYNEENAIGNTIENLKREFPNAEIIVVDDGSTDRTGEIARSFQGVKNISHGRNKGYGASLKTAMKAATGEVIAWFDADGQHRAEDLKKIMQPVIDGTKDAVIGARGKGSDIKIDRVPGKILLKLVAELITREKILDLNSGLRCFRHAVIRKYLHLLPDGFSASTTTTLLMIKRGYRLGYMEITTNKRVGKSYVNILKDGRRTLLILIRMLVLFESFNFFALLSLLQIIPALLYGITFAVIKEQGIPVLASTIMLSGVSTFFIGILCDQITELRKEKFEE